MGQQVAVDVERRTSVDAYAYHIARSIQDVATALQQAVQAATPQVALVTITLQFEPSRSGKRARSLEQSAAYFLESIRPLTRRTDIVLLLGNTYYFILLGAAMEGGRIVQERLWEALLWRVHNVTEEEAQRPCTLSIGHSAYPQPCESRQSCIAEANVARMSIDFGPPRSTGVTRVQVEQDEELPLLARKLGVPYLSLLPRNLPSRLQHLVSSRLAEELHCYPVGRERDTLTVAMADPQDRRALARLHEETGLRIFPVLTNAQELQGALEQWRALPQR